MRASSSSERSPTPVPASMSTLPSSRNDVVLQRAAMAPEQPRTRMIMRNETKVDLDVDSETSRAQAAQVSFRRQSRGCRGAIGHCREMFTAQRPGSSELDELHLGAGELDHVAVIQLHRLVGQRIAGAW